MNTRHFLPIMIGLAAVAVNLSAQTAPFFFGSDLSYVNELEDCGVTYKENGQAKDVYDIFSGHGTNLVRLRLWHTPSWYDGLNSGKRYSDYNDVRKAILRAQTAGMAVLLDFHLSDNWADPSKQVVPAAWAPVVNNLPVLQDSLYNYIYSTLFSLNQQGLLPEMVQIGNETNKGILLSQAQNEAGWQLNWPRNAALFKKAIQAVRDVETATGKDIEVALHVAGPADVNWLMEGFWNNGVQDFDVIGMSYYWAWHKPTTIQQTGNIIAGLKTTYPGKKVMIFETGYIWSTQNVDNASNIISEVQAGYAPASPANQKKWLIDLTQEVINKGGSGVCYWEPAWVSSGCFTQWGQGSHQEHATFFDFQKNVLPEGGMFWPAHNYTGLSSASDPVVDHQLTITVLNTSQVQIKTGQQQLIPVTLHLYSADGRLVADTTLNIQETALWSTGKALPTGLYFVTADAPKQHFRPVKFHIP